MVNNGEGEKNGRFVAGDMRETLRLPAFQPSLFFLATLR